MFDQHNTFQDIIIDTHNFSNDFCKFFKSIISLDICFDGGYFINMQKAKIYKCLYFHFIRNPSKLFLKFLSILIRLYLNICFIIP